ncbi:MAG: VWA domain-containing protein, partial [Polyangiaceae bacterium]|nr:VWA domain-containing protein [Polyangiaceae bacterium]
MAFNSVVIFAVAHVDGGSGRLRRVQLNFPIQVQTADASSSAPGSSIDIHNLESDPTHEPFQLANGYYDLAYNSTADLSFSMDRFLALDPADQEALAQSFANGSTLTLDVHVDGIGGSVQLPLQLRALKTSDFLFSGNSAEVAHYGSVTGANLTLPGSDAIGNYSFTVAEDVDASFNPVGYQTLVTYNSGSTPPGALTFPGAPPPLDTSNDDGFRVIIAHSPTSSISVLRVDTHFPTETIVLIDRSGSMSGTAVAPYSKWEKALEAAHLFAKIYGTALPATPSSGITDAYKIKLGSFAFVSSGYSSTYAPASGFNVSTNPPVLTESSGGATPIGEALVEANGLFSSGQWRRRHLLLLTDGMDNLHGVDAPSLIEVRDDDPSVHVPSLYDYVPSGSTGDPNDGVVIHTFGYALSEEAPVFDLALLADKHGGLSLPSNPGSDPDVLDPDLLQAKFLDVLTTILPVERSLPTSGYTFNVEDGLERVIFIATAEYVPGTDPSFHASSATTGQESSSGTEGTGNGFSWAWVDNPDAAADWIVSNVPSAPVFALFDPALRMRCSVDASGLGQSIKLRARVTHGGAAVSGASIRVGVYRPGESMGELLTRFVQQGGLVRAIVRGTLDKRVLGGGLTPLLAARSSAFAVAPKSQTPAGVATVTAAQAAAGVGSPDTKSLRRILLEGAEHERNLAIQAATNSIVLSEVAPGRYEAELPGAMTQDEGAYNFHFRADGKTPNGHAFARNQWRSAVLAPIPDPETSEVTVLRSTVAGQTVWTATVLPRTATGRPIGPGMGTLVSFQ